MVCLFGVPVCCFLWSVDRLLCVANFGVATNVRPRFFVNKGVARGSERPMARNFRRDSEGPLVQQERRVAANIYRG